MQDQKNISAGIGCWVAAAEATDQKFKVLCKECNGFQRAGSPDVGTWYYLDLEPFEVAEPGPVLKFQYWVGLCNHCGSGHWIWFRLSWRQNITATEHQKGALKEGYDLGPTRPLGDQSVKSLIQKRVYGAYEPEPYDVDPRQSIG